MKKLFVGTLFMLVILCTSQAQRPELGEQAQERIEAFKIAFFTEELQLTPAESQVFWPLFNEFENKREALREKYDLKGKKLELLSDDEVKDHIMNQIRMEEEQTELRRTYVMKFMEVLPIRKVAQLQRADTLFKKRLLEEIQKRRAQRPGGGMNPRRN